jgi:hypothetical protein
MKLVHWGSVLLGFRNFRGQRQFQSVKWPEERAEFDSGQVRNFYLLLGTQTGSVTHLTSYPVSMGGSSRVKGSDPAPDHSPPSGAKAKNFCGTLCSLAYSHARKITVTGKNKLRH